MTNPGKEIRIKYKTEEVSVIWQPHLCIHSGICARGLPEVFRPREKPWVDIQAESAEAIRAQVYKCPSGALSISEEENSAQEK
jgi:uncharacterized Fe-S cluster protein YjdI